MSSQSSMFGDTPHTQIQNNVKMILENNPSLSRQRPINLESVFKEFLPLYSIEGIQNHPQWPLVWKLILDANTIQRRVRDFENGKGIFDPRL